MPEITITPSQLGRALETCIRARRPVCVWGEPGIGKSQIVRQTTERMGLEFRDVRGSLLDAVDIHGLPTIGADGRMHWAIPEWLPMDGEGVLFLDEITRATGMVQNALFSLILDRRIGEYELPSGWTVIAASNREIDGGGTTKMYGALANRFLHLNLVTDVREWQKYALTPAAGIEPVVVAFFGLRPELLQAFNPKEKANPTARTWEFVSDIVKSGFERDIEMALIAGTVGQGAAIEFIAFVEMWRQLPSIDAILMNPATEPVPSAAGTMYAVASALAQRASVTNFGRIKTYLDRCGREYAAFAVSTMTTRDPSLRATPEFVAWGIENQDIL